VGTEKELPFLLCFSSVSFSSLIPPLYSPATFLPHLQGDHFLSIFFSQRNNVSMRYSLWLWKNKVTFLKWVLWTTISQTSVPFFFFFGIVICTFSSWGYSSIFTPRLTSTACSSCLWLWLDHFSNLILTSPMNR
jgi:hypothetical protein